MGNDIVYLDILVNRPIVIAYSMAAGLRGDCPVKHG